MKLISSSPALCLLLIPSLVTSPLWAEAPLTPAPALTAPENAAPAASDLQIRLVAGADAASARNSAAGQSLTVAVTNTAGLPVSDAAVAVRLPDSGPTGSFADGSHAAVSYTDSSGQARFDGLHWGRTPGSLTMRITANKGTSHAALLVDRSLATDGATLVKVVAPAAPSASGPREPGQTARTQPPPASAPAIVTPAPSPLAVTPAPKPEPTVSVTGASPEASKHSGKAKWIILAAVAAAAGAGFAVAGKGKSNSSTPTASGISIGAPSVSVGAPTNH